MTDPSSHRVDPFPCGRTRRRFLTDMAGGFGGLALGAMLHGDGVVRGAEGQPSRSAPHFPAKAKNVIWLFMAGGVSHLESFDPKPAINKYAGLTVEESPVADQVLNSPFYRKNVRDFAGGPRKLMPRIYPLQVGFKPRGTSGIEVSDWWPHVGSMVDDLALVRSCWCSDNDHAAQYEFHTAHHIFDGYHPSIGSWVHYGLGSLNDDLPSFVAIGDPPGVCCGGKGAHSAAYLGPEHSAVQLKFDAHHPLAYASPGNDTFEEEQAGQFELLRGLNRVSAGNHPNDPNIQARIKSYELAFRMQASVPEVFALDRETAATANLYGLNHPTTKPFGESCLLARRLVERGVRFVQLYHGSGGGGSWDAHANLLENHAKMTSQVDRPIAGLLQDLKQRGLLEETIVVWATEFGRTPGEEGSKGRDHHPYGFTVWLAGGGIKGGMVHGATDEIGFHAVEHRHYVSDIHATVLKQLGLNARMLEIPGHKRLEMDIGKPIDHIIA
jgi:hypothetical protein